jgi:hypothetical protein
MSSAITCTVKGNFKKTNSFLERCLNFVKLGRLDHYGRVGVEAFRNNTPKYTGLAASSWYYKIERNDQTASLIFCNDDIEGGLNVAILIAYGHGTRGGVYVPGVDYITPSMKKVLVEVANDMRKEIGSL